MKKAVFLWMALVFLLPASAGAVSFSTHVGWYSDGPWYDCRPWYRPWYSWRRPYWCGEPWPRYVQVKKQESILSELRRKESQERQAAIERIKRYNEKFKETHGEYPKRQVIFSPNHPEAR